MLQRRVELPLFFRQNKDRSPLAKPVELGKQQAQLAASEPAGLSKRCELPVVQSDKSGQPSAPNWVYAHSEVNDSASTPPASYRNAIPPTEERPSTDLSSLLQNQRLRQVERKLRSSLNLATVLGATVVETAAFFQVKQVSLLRHDTIQHRWQPVAQYCENQDLAWQQPFSFSADEFPALIETLQQGHSVHISSNREDAIAQERLRWRSQWPGNWLLVPVKRRQPMDYSLNSAISLEAAEEASNHEHWGIMALACANQQSWSAQQATQSQSIVVELEWAIAQAHQHQELILANQELQKLALSDGLTRLANRRRFDEHLADEWQRLARDQQPLSLILCDLDHFKRYNDAFGHPAGDRCLIRVAKALLNGPQRPADLVARYGGEEFAVILPNTDTHGAWRIAQKIHEHIRDLKIEHAPNHEEKYITVTMGVSTVLPGHNSTAQMLVQAADLALYHAKQQGRNRTYVHAHYNTVDTDLERGSKASLDMTPAED